MWKNIGKSLLWGWVYTAASTVGILSVMIFSLFMDPSIFMLDADAFFNAWMSLVMDVAIPGMFIANIICIIVYCGYKRVRKYNPEITKITFSRSAFCLSLGVAFNLIITYVLDYVWTYLPEDIIHSAEEASAMLSTDQYSWVFLLLVIGITTPIAEEIVFRHGFCRVLSRSNVWVGVLFSSLLFGFAHANLVQGVYTFVLGLICAIVLLRTNNIWYPIFIHMGLNCTTVLSNAVSEDVAMLVFTTAGFVCLTICTTMLIHKKDIQTLFMKEKIQEPIEVEDAKSVNPPESMTDIEL